MNELDTITSSNEFGKRLVINLENLNEEKSFLNELLKKTNAKDYGEQVTMREIFLLAIHKINDKDIERLKEQSITPKQRIEKAYRNAVENENFKGTLEDFICSRIKI